MKLFSRILTVLFLTFMVNSRVLLNRRTTPQRSTKLFTNYPRYLVPNKNPIDEEFPKEDSAEHDDKILLDNNTPQERKLFMMTDYEAQKKRFGQRMDCKCTY